MPYKNKADDIACRARAYARRKNDPEFMQRMANFSREWRKANPEAVKEQKRRHTKKYLEANLFRIKEWKEKNPERYLETSRQYAKTHNTQRTRQIKAAMIEAYGGKCVCCGETEEAFLTIDHIFGKGHEHRGKEGIRGSQIYYWLKKRGYPKDAYRLLCFNCNCARGLRGICPHESAQPKLELMAC